MVEISKLINLQVYTIAGEYVGKIHNIVLNMRLGTISKLQVMALTEESKDIGPVDLLRRSLSLTPDEEDFRNLKEGLRNVDYDDVKAIGDIILIDIKNSQKTVNDKEIPEITDL